MVTSSAAYDKDLNPLLERSSTDDLAPLVEYIIKEGGKTNSLERNERYLALKPQHSFYSDLIAQEIRAYGGHSFVNAIRGHGVSYKEVVMDVADKQKANYKKEWSVEQVELSILLKLLKLSWEKMNDTQKHELLENLGTDKSQFRNVNFSIFPEELLRSFFVLNGGFAIYSLASILAKDLAQNILGAAIAATIVVTTEFVASRGILLPLGPVGLAVGGLWAVVDLAGPAYRVTTPCVVHIAMLRQRAKAIHDIEESREFLDAIYKDHAASESWVGSILSTVGLITKSELERREQQAREAGVEAGRMMQSESNASMLEKYMENLYHRDRIVVALCSVAFAAAREKGGGQISEKKKEEIERNSKGFYQNSQRIVDIIRELQNEGTSLGEAVKDARALGVDEDEINRVIDIGRAD